MAITINIRLHTEDDDYLIAIADAELAPLPAHIQAVLEDLGCTRLEGFTSIVNDEVTHPNVFVFSSTEEFWFPIATDIMQAIYEAAPDATVIDHTDESA